MPLISALAVALAIALSGRKGLHPGAAAIALAWLIGRRAGPPAGGVAALFPSDLFLLLVGITLFFRMAHADGTMERLVRLLLRLAGKRPVFLPPLFFACALLASTLGAGNIGAVALLAPLALESGRRAGISPLLTSILVVGGANAGAFSPLAFTGVVINGLAGRLGVRLDSWGVYWPNLAAQAGLALAIYAGALPQLRALPEIRDGEDLQGSERPVQWATLGALLALAVGVIAFNANAGLLALALSGLLGLLGVSDQGEALERLPWQAILMVCGVSTLVGLASEHGGLRLVAGWLSRAGPAPLVSGAASFLAGFVSIYSSSSGVVLPAFIPMVGEISARSGADPAALVSSISVASHLVDASPLSTLGALCVAAVPEGERGDVFRKLLYFGLGMSVVGGLIGVLFGLLPGGAPAR